MKLSLTRFEENPIVFPDLSSSIGSNINGPSLIRVPEWVPNRLGSYYLYFAHHQGKYIRLAYADHLWGPWKIYEPGVLQLNQTPFIGHIASPDTHVDEEKKEFRLYFHGPVVEGGQKTRLALSKDGLSFQCQEEILGEAYFRMFKYNGYYYALQKPGILLRSRDGLRSFEQGPDILDQSQNRHSAVYVHGNNLYVFYSRIADCPERILVSMVPMNGNWTSWKAAVPPITVLEPETNYEGIDLPLLPSKSGAIHQPVRQLRDPAVFEEGSRLYLLYSVSGESGIAIARMKIN